jgi:hypothetical protein
MLKASETSSIVSTKAFCLATANLPAPSRLDSLNYCRAAVATKKSMLTSSQRLDTSSQSTVTRKLDKQWEHTPREQKTGTNTAAATTCRIKQATPIVLTIAPN